MTLLKLHYTFNPTENLAITVGPRIEANDFVDVNSYANDEVADFSSNFFINNSLDHQESGANGGAGAAIDWNVLVVLYLRAAYVSASPRS